MYNPHIYNKKRSLCRIHYREFLTNNQCKIYKCKGLGTKEYKGYCCKHFRILHLRSLSGNSPSFYSLPIRICCTLPCGNTCNKRKRYCDTCYMSQWRASKRTEKTRRSRSNNLGDAVCNSELLLLSDRAEEEKEGVMAVVGGPHKEEEKERECIFKTGMASPSSVGCMIFESVVNFGECASLRSPSVSPMDTATQLVTAKKRRKTQKKNGYHHNHNSGTKRNDLRHLHSHGPVGIGPKLEQACRYFVMSCPTNDIT